jgi:hypothetical protein
LAVECRSDPGENEVDGNDDAAAVVDFDIEVGADFFEDAGFNDPDSIDHPTRNIFKTQFANYFS